jgi:hypothetical protein
VTLDPLRRDNEELAQDAIMIIVIPAKASWTLTFVRVTKKKAGERPILVIPASWTQLSLG